MDATIPRNELSAISLCTELAFLVKRALGDLVDEIIYCTDSPIVLSWCRNMRIKLRLFVYNRVMTILQMWEWTTGKTEVPLFHIDGKLNLADLLSNQHNLSIKSVTLNSQWQNGLPWMLLDNESMPLLAYDQLRVEKLIEDEVRVECYDDAMTGKFSQFDECSVLPTHDQLRVEKPNEDEVRVEYSKNVITEELFQTEDNSVHCFPLLLVWPGCRSTC